MATTNGLQITIRAEGFEEYAAWFRQRGEELLTEVNALVSFGGISDVLAGIADQTEVADLERLHDLPSANE